MMKRSWRRYWSIATVTGTVLAVVAVAVALDYHKRRSQNYSRIEDGLYLGGRVVEAPPGTRAVLNLCEWEDPYQAEVHRWQPIPDAAPAPSIAWLRQQVEFVDQQRRAGLPVFVHCKAGVSRGGLVTVAYLMWREGWSREQALEFVQLRRAVVQPNSAFMDLLQEWEQSLNGPGSNSAPSAPGGRARN